MKHTHIRLALIGSLLAFAVSACGGNESAPAAALRTKAALTEVNVAHALRKSGVGITGGTPYTRTAAQMDAIASEIADNITRLNLDQVADLLVGLGFELPAVNDSSSSFAPQQNNKGADAQSIVEAQLKNLPPEMREQIRAQVAAAMKAEAKIPAQSPQIPGRQLQRMLAGLVEVARKHPNAASSYPLLLLDERAKAQTPSIDLTGEYGPASLRWGLFEIELFLATFARHMRSTTPIASRASSGIHLVGRKLPPDACGALGEWVTSKSQEAGALGGLAVEKGSDAVAEKILGELGGKSLEAFRAIGELTALAEFYKSAHIKVRTISDNPAHKTVEGEAKRHAKFKAELGATSNIPEGDPGLIEGCMKKIGMGSPSTVRKELLDDVKNWKVDWDFELSPEDVATYNAADNALHLSGEVTKTTMSGAASAEATFTFELATEPKEVHKSNSSKQRTGYIVATAKLMSAKMPDPTGLVSLGLAIGALTQTTTGLIRELFMPKATTVMQITYHGMAGYVFEKWIGDVRLAGKKCGSPVGEWTIYYKGRTAPGVYITDGKITAHIAKPDMKGNFVGHTRAVMPSARATFFWDFRGTSEYDFQRQLLILESKGQHVGRVVMDGESQSLTANTAPIWLIPVRYEEGVCE